MKIKAVSLIIILIASIFIICSNPATSQAPSFVFEHQDPAGDVLKFNATENGTTATGAFFEPLDIKWLYSEEDGTGNVLITTDLKAKNKFFNRDDTKYVFRILTAEDNSTGYNITYNNRTAIMNSFSPAGNGTKVNIDANVTFVQDKGDEMMEITIEISKYLDNISYYNLDAYSMMVTSNATYLDYISELPGHPEYVSPSVKESEDLNGDGDSGDEDDDSDNNAAIFFAIIMVVVIIIVIVIVLLIWLMKRRR
jgi:hypothetical protein